MKKKMIFIKTPFSCLLLTAITLFSPFALSEITLDGSMGATGSLAGPDYQITEDLGQRAGSNLFHSFGKFNINSAESATFSGSAGINNVISRVTGGQASTIDGAFQSTIPGANIYFLNPSGVIFGENASLDVQGSFHASTADYLKFKDGVKFETGLANANPILTIASPEAFGFLDDTPAPITVSGGLNKVLKVPEGETLSLVAGDISINDRSLYAPSGQVVLASAGSAGEVVFNESGIDTSSFSQGGKIHLSRLAENPVATINNTMRIADIDVSADAAGKVVIRGGQMVMDNAYVWANTTNKDGSDIDINLAGDLTINGVAEIAGVEKTPQSGIKAYSLGGGNVGDIVLNIDDLKLTHGSQVDSIAGSSGKGGNLNITANSILLEGNDSKAVPKFTTATSGTGDAGNITITNTGKLEINKNASIGTITTNKGDSGAILIKTGTLDLHDKSMITNFVAIAAEGNGGGLTINATDSITLNNAATIANSTGGKGDAGALTIEATNDLKITKGSVINSSPFGAGNGGETFIKANTIFLSGEEAEKPTGIINSVSGAGNTGNLNITSHKIEILDGARISAGNFGSGNNGDITLNVKEGSILLSGRNKNTGFRSSINSGTNGIGNPGNLTINAKSMEIKEGGTINAITMSNSNNTRVIQINSSSLLLSGGAILTGTQNFNGLDVDIDIPINNVGNNTSAGATIDLNITGKLKMENDSRISANTATNGQAGDVYIDAGSIELSEATITTSASNFVNETQQDSSLTGNAGDISIVTQSLDLKNGSWINSDTSTIGHGGNITIDAKSVFLSGSRPTEEGRFYSTISTDTNSKDNDAGNAGNITLNNVDQLKTQDASISVDSDGAGSGGNLAVNAKSIIISGKNSPKLSGLIARTSSNKDNAGNAGNIVINSEHIDISDEGLIDLSTTGAGKGGNLKITAETISLSGKDSPHQTGIVISTKSTENNAGDAGDANITVGHLNITDTAIISTNTQGNGNGGNLTIDAQSITLKGDGSNTFTGITSQASGTTDGITGHQGNAGNLTLLVKDSLTLHNWAEISASTFDVGKAGDLFITANDILLNDSVIVSSSNLSEIDLSNNADIAKSGNIVISANNTLTLENNSAIFVSTEKANAGEITITGGSTLTLSDSKISTSVANGEGHGGNITLNNPLIALDKSQILAQAKQGGGGNISIPGFVFQSPSSSIDATSEKNVDGQLNLKPDTNISGSIAVLPNSTLNASEQLRDSCTSRSGNNANSFVVKSRGGVPLSPNRLSPATFMDISSVNRHFVQNTKNETPSFSLAENTAPLLHVQQIDCIY